MVINDNKNVTLVISECVEFVLFPLIIDKHDTYVCAMLEMRMLEMLVTGEGKGYVNVLSEYKCILKYFI